MILSHPLANGLTRRRFIVVVGRCRKKNDVRHHRYRGSLHRATNNDNMIAFRRLLFRSPDETPPFATPILSLESETNLRYCIFQRAWRSIDVSTCSGTLHKKSPYLFFISLSLYLSIYFSLSLLSLSPSPLPSFALLWCLYTCSKRAIGVTQLFAFRKYDILRSFPIIVTIND